MILPLCVSAGSLHGVSAFVQLRRRVGNPGSRCQLTSFFEFRCYALRTEARDGGFCSKTPLQAHDRFREC